MLRKESAIVIEMNKNMHDGSYATLTSCYLPLMGEKAYILYLTLLSLKRQNFALTNHLLVHKISNLSYEAMESARKKLEEFLLLRTYYNASEDKYLYVLDKPMKAPRFLSHEVFGRLFIDKMGKDAFAFYKQQLNRKRVNKTGFEEVSATMQDTLKNNWNPDKEKDFQDIKETAQSLRFENLQIIFDEKIFLSGLSEMVFPKKERTTQNLRMIAEIATIYGINEKMMRRLIGRGMDVSTQKFDATRLRNACMSSKAKYVSDNKDPYKLPTRRYLEYKQNGVALSNADLRLVEKLLIEYALPSEVANVLLETCMLITKSNEINGTLVDRKAAGWMRLKIDTLEKAKAQQKVELTKKGSDTNKATIVQEWKSDDTMSEEERMKLIEEMEKWGE